VSTVIYTQKLLFTVPKDVYDMNHFFLTQYNIGSSLAVWGFIGQ